MGEITKEEMRERLGNIDQIRDIIFGSQVREYNNRFEKIESDLSMMQQEMHDYAEQVKSIVSSELRAVVDSVDKKLKSLSLNTQEENADLQQQLDRINRKFSKNIETLDEAVDKQTTSMRDELSQTKEKLLEEVRTLRNQVFEELDKRLSLLRDVKVSRDDMAEMLFELGMRLKGTEFVPELRAAADTNMYTDVRIIESKPNSD